MPTEWTRGAAAAFVWPQSDPREESWQITAIDPKWLSGERDETDQVSAIYLAPGAGPDLGALWLRRSREDRGPETAELCFSLVGPDLVPTSGPECSTGWQPAHQPGARAANADGNGNIALPGDAQALFAGHLEAGVAALGPGEFAAAWLGSTAPSSDLAIFAGHFVCSQVASAPSP